MGRSQAGPASAVEFAAFLAIDWADQKHVWKLYVPESGSFESGELNHRPEEIEVWATGLAERFGSRPIAVALEQSRGALLYILTKYGHFKIHPVHPATLASYRKSFSPSGAKDDDRDVALILDLLLKHGERLRPLPTETTETRLLALLSEQRRHQVDQKTAQLNRLTTNLKLYFPQILEWFSDQRLIDFDDDEPEAVPVRTPGLGTDGFLELPQAFLPRPSIAPLEVVPEKVKTADLRGVHQPRLFRMQL
jgi:hypothetical protein